MPRNTTSSKVRSKQTPGITQMVVNMKLLLNNRLQAKTHLKAFGSGS